jgi:circadian clock protein KaiC
MSQNAGIPRRLADTPTGVPGLDVVLQGGFLSGGVYIVQGSPGAGKTILANQICFYHASQGGRALYSTVLAESHDRLLQHIASLRFVDTRVIPESLRYVSAFRELEEQGLAGLINLLRREVLRQQVSLLVLDGWLAIADGKPSDISLRKFVHELQVFAALQGCVVLLLTSDARRDYRPEYTMVDGLLALDDVRHLGWRQRELEVLKFRGKSFLRGRHAFRITGEGIRVYPRLEALLPLTPESDVPTSRLSIGIKHMDRMLHGGLPAASTTIVVGPSGSGKTTLALHFLSCASEAEPGLMFGFFETPRLLIANARALGLDLAGQVDAGHVELIWHSPTEQILDDIGNQLLDAITRRNVKRLAVDGLDGLVEAAGPPDRVSRFFAAISNECRARGVSMLLNAESANFVGPTVTLPIEGISAIVDNLILLRFVEARARLHRLISVLKLRGSNFDRSLREFEITDRGIEVLEALSDTDIAENAPDIRIAASPANSPVRRRQNREPG